MARGFDRLRHAAHRWIRESRRTATSCLRAARLTAYALQGETPRGQPLAILYAGGESYMHYLTKLAFAEGTATRERLGRYWVWQLPMLARRRDVELRVTRGNRLVAALGCARGAFYVPEWVWVHLALDRESLFTSPSRSQRRELRRLESNRLTFCATTDREQLRHFHERMYLPMMRASHGEGALLMGFEYMMQRVGAGEAELVSIKQGEKPVAGCLIVYDAGEARLFSQGILGADRDLLRQRVGVAIYLFSFAHLLSKGYDRVNLGRSRPFLTDGPLMFKRHLGGELTNATADGVFLLPLRRCAAVEDFLEHNPFACLERGGLHGLAFSSRETAADELRERYYMSGLARFTVVPLSAFDSPNELQPARSAREIVAE